MEAKATTTAVERLTQEMLDEMPLGGVRLYTLPTMLGAINAQSNVGAYNKAKGYDNGIVVRSIRNAESPQILVIKLPKGEWA